MNVPQKHCTEARIDTAIGNQTTKIRSTVAIDPVEPARNQNTIFRQQVKLLQRAVEHGPEFSDWRAICGRVRTAIRRHRLRIGVAALLIALGTLALHLGLAA